MLSKAQVRTTVGQAVGAGAAGKGGEGARVSQRVVGDDVGADSGANGGQEHA